MIPIGVIPVGVIPPVSWAAYGASPVKTAADQWLQFVAEGLAWVAGVMQAAWTWTSEQIVRMADAPWGAWPLWKQLVLIVVAGAVIYTLFLAAQQLWWAVVNLLSAVAAFIGTLIVTLPTILLAGAIALGGLWLINNFHDLSSLRPIPAGDGGGTPPGPARQ